MLAFYLRIVWDALRSTPSLIGENWVSVIFSLGIFLIVFVVKARGEPKWKSAHGWRKKIATVRGHWAKTADLGARIVVGAWVGLFAVSLVKTVYQNHAAEADQITTIERENRTLKRQSATLVDPRSRDNEIAKLQTKVRGLQARLESMKPRHICRFWNHPEPPIPEDKGKSATSVFISCNYKLETPWLFRVTFNSSDWYIPRITYPGADISPANEKHGRDYIGGSSTTSIAPWGVITINVQSKSPSYVRAIRIERVQ